MAKVKWRFNIDGFAQLRNHPDLVSAMESSMRGAVAGTPFEVEVWAHPGRRRGPRTSVQAWARTPEAMGELHRDQTALHKVLQRTGIPFEAKQIYQTRDGRLRGATQAQIDNWTRGRR